MPSRVIVVGAGSISREYALTHFTPDATGTTVVGIVDPDEEKASALAADVGSVQAGIGVLEKGGNKYRATAIQRGGMSVPYYRSLEEAMKTTIISSSSSPQQSGTEDDGFDLVYIGTTPKSHRMLVEMALAAGKHVLLEKPISTTMEDADAIVNAADLTRRHTGAVLGMNIGMRYNAALIEMRHRLFPARDSCASQNEKKSYHAYLRTHYSQWPREWQTQPWCAGKDEGGPLREVGTHFFAALLELVGAYDEEIREPVIARVMAKVTYPHQEVTDDELAPCETDVSGVIELSGGLLNKDLLNVDLSVRTDQARDLYELEVHVTDNEKELKLTLFDFTSLRDDANDGNVIIKNASYGRRECVLAILSEAEKLRKDSVSSSSEIKSSAPTLVTARHGRNAQRIIDGLLRSQGNWIDVTIE